MGRREQVLKQLKLEQVQVTGEVAENFEKLFRSRVEAFRKLHFEKYPPQIEHLSARLDQFARDVYLQGVMDGAQAAVMRPQMAEIFREDTSGEPAAGT